ncbi:hypothetical protein [Pseudomonas sp.]|uniref:hypothetical protein n=1 Tax=Pseudomonas sp. TaxID=306 RepID=UPI003BB7DC56
MKPRAAFTFPDSQQGIVLLVSLTMLLLVTLIVVSGFNLTQTNLKVVHNLESRALARHAADSALEEALSSNLYLSGSVFVSSCEKQNQKCYDINGDGLNDVKVFIELSCTIATPLSNDNIAKRMGVTTFPTLAEGEIPDAFEGGGSAWSSCQGDTPNGNSLCSDVVWDFLATATDLQTGAEVKVRQGVASPADSNTVSSICD